VKAARKRFEEHTQVQEDAARVVVVDESGVDTAMAPLYGWSLVGKPAVIEAPVRGDRISIIAGLALDGLRDWMVIEGSINGELFLQWLREGLIPTLKKGDLVILDNCSIHKVDGVKQAIESAGARLMYLPPYSPDYSPMENWYSKFKNSLRKEAARTKQALIQAMVRASATISIENVCAWFEHCGWKAHYA